MSDSGEDLSMLNLGETQITEVPSELTEITILQMNGNQLRNIPQDIGKLTKLQELNIANTQITETPPELYKLKNLTSLDMSNNQLKCIPEDIGNLKKLQKLDVTANQVEIIPIRLFKLKELNELHMDDNTIYIIPEGIGKLRALKKLSLGKNNIKELPLDIFDLKELTELDMHENKLTTIPQDICKLKKLRRVNFQANQIKNVPLDLFAMQNLTELNMSGNQMKMIPSNISEKLRVLRLSDNSIRYLNNAVLTQASKLEELSLDGNPLVDPPIAVCKRGLKAMMQYTGGDDTMRVVRVMLKPSDYKKMKYELLSGFWLCVHPKTVKCEAELEVEILNTRPNLDDFEELESRVINISSHQTSFPSVTLEYPLEFLDLSRDNVIVRSMDYYYDGIVWHELKSAKMRDFITTDITACGMYAVKSKPQRTNFLITPRAGTYTSDDNMASLETTTGAVTGNIDTTMEVHDLRSFQESISTDNDMSASSAVIFRGNDGKEGAVNLNALASVSLRSPSPSISVDRLALRVLSSRNYGEDWEDITESVTPTVKDDMVSFNIKQLKGYGVAHVPSSRIRHAVTFFCKVFNWLRRRKHTAKVLLLQHEVQQCLLLVDVVRSLYIHEQITKWKDNGFKSIHENDVPYSQDLTIANGDVISVETSPPFIIESMITNTTFFASRDNHLKPKVRCTNEEPARGANDVIGGTMLFYLREDPMSELHFWVSKNYEDSSRRTGPHEGESSSSEYTRLFRFLARKLLSNQWKPLASRLGIEDFEINRIEFRYPRDLNEQIYQMFRLWEGKQWLRGAELIDKLCSALEQEGLRARAEEVRNFLETDTKSQTKKKKSGVCLMI
ncbi:uncharacterized protein LOC144441353 [Glandiceps talaboti]